MIAALAGFTIALLSTLLLTPIVARRHAERGIVGRDVHKPGGPLIPEMGGVSIVIGLALAYAASMVMEPQLTPHLASLTACIVLAAVIGAYDDLRGMRAWVKTALTIVCCAPIVIAALAAPTAIQLGRPVLPLVGRLRLTIIYWALLPFAIAVPANAVNMMDVYNGVMPGTCLLASIALLASGLILGKEPAVIMASPLIGSLAAYYRYNRYPARVFSGDVGSLSVGAAIGAIAVLGGLEIVGIVALMPHIMNAFHSLASIRGLMERHEIECRPVIVDGGVLKANTDPRAPMTLANLMLLDGPLTEPELVKCYIGLSAIACALAIVTALLMEVSL